MYVLNKSKTLVIYICIYVYISSAINIQYNWINFNQNIIPITYIILAVLNIYLINVKAFFILTNYKT